MNKVVSKWTQRMISFVLCFIMTLGIVSKAVIPIFAVDTAHTYYIQTTVDTSTWRIMAAVVNDKKGWFGNYTEVERIGADTLESLKITKSGVQGIAKPLDKGDTTYNTTGGSSKNNKVLSFPGSHKEGWNTPQASDMQLDRAIFVKDRLVYDLNVAIEKVYGDDYKPTEPTESDDGSQIYFFQEDLNAIISAAASKSEVSGTGWKFESLADAGITVKADDKNGISTSDYVVLTNGDTKIPLLMSILKYPVGTPDEESGWKNDSDTKYVTWNQIAYEAIANSMLKDDPVTTNNLYSNTSPNFLSKALGELFESLVYELQSLLGLWSIEDLVFNQGIRGTNGYVSGVFPESWQRFIWTFFIISEICSFAIILFSILKNVTERAAATVNPVIRANLMDQVKDMGVAVIALALLPYLLIAAMKLSAALTGICSTMVGDKVLSGTGAGGGVLAAVIVSLFRLGITVYFNAFYIIRALMVSVLMSVSPLFVMAISLGGRKKQMAQQWAIELAANIFIQPIQALMLSFIILVPKTGRVIETLAMTFCMIPLTGMFKSILFPNSSDIANRGAEAINEKSKQFGKAAIGTAIGAIGAGAALIGNRKESKKMDDNGSMKSSQASEKEKTKAEAQNGAGNVKEKKTNTKNGKPDFSGGKPVNGSSGQVETGAEAGAVGSVNEAGNPMAANANKAVATNGKPTAEPNANTVKNAAANMNAANGGSSGVVPNGNDIATDTAGNDEKAIPDDGGVTAEPSQPDNKNFLGSVRDKAENFIKDPVVAAKAKKSWSAAKMVACGAVCGMVNGYNGRPLTGADSRRFRRATAQNLQARNELADAKEAKQNAANAAELNDQANNYSYRDANLSADDVENFGNNGTSFDDNSGVMNEDDMKNAGISNFNYNQETGEADYMVDATKLNDEGRQALLNATQDKKTAAACAANGYKVSRSKQDDGMYKITCGKNPLTGQAAPSMNGKKLSFGGKRQNLLPNQQLMQANMDSSNSAAQNNVPQDDRFTDPTMGRMPFTEIPSQTAAFDVNAFGTGEAAGNSSHFSKEQLESAGVKKIRRSDDGALISTVSGKNISRPNYENLAYAADQGREAAMARGFEVNPITDAEGNKTGDFMITTREDPVTGKAAPRLDWDGSVTSGGNDTQTMLPDMKSITNEARDVKIATEFEQKAAPILQQAENDHNAAYERAGVQIGEMKEVVRSGAYNARQNASRELGRKVQLGRAGENIGHIEGAKFESGNNGIVSTRIPREAFDDRNIVVNTSGNTAEITINEDSVTNDTGLQELNDRCCYLQDSGREQEIASTVEAWNAKRQDIGDSRSASASFDPQTRSTKVTITSNNGSNFGHYDGNDFVVDNKSASFNSSDRLPQDIQLDSADHCDRYRRETADRRYAKNTDVEEVAFEKLGYTQDEVKHIKSGCKLKSSQKRIKRNNAGNGKKKNKHSK